MCLQEAVQKEKARHAQNCSSRGSDGEAGQTGRECRGLKARIACEPGWTSNPSPTLTDLLRPPESPDSLKTPCTRPQIIPTHPHSQTQTCTLAHTHTRVSHLFTPTNALTYTITHTSTHAHGHIDTNSPPPHSYTHSWTHTLGHTLHTVIHNCHNSLTIKFTHLPPCSYLGSTVQTAP